MSDSEHLHEQCVFERVGFETCGFLECRFERRGSVTGAYTQGLE